MPKNENVIQFSLNTEQREKVKALGIGNESIGLTAKRILLEAIGEPTKPISLLEQPELIAHIADLVQRVTFLEMTKENDRSDIAFIENIVKGTVNDMNPPIDRLTRIESTLAALDADREEINSSQLTELVDRITTIEVAIDCEHYPEEKVSDRLTAIESALAELQRQINQATSPVKRTSSPPPRSRKK
jgi:chromosome segregation ATPase